GTPRRGRARRPARVPAAGFHPPVSGTRPRRGTRRDREGARRGGGEPHARRRAPRHGPHDPLAEGEDIRPRIESTRTKKGPVVGALLILHGAVPSASRPTFRSRASGTTP